MFNVLTFAKNLEAAGVPRRQAEAHAQCLAELVESEISTKRDLKELEYRLTIKLSAIMGTMFTIFGIITTIVSRLSHY